SGDLKWRKEFAKQYSRTSPLFGTAMSPLVVDGLVIAHVGGHDKGAPTAFDAETGAEKWTNPLDGPGYASPILVTLADVRQLITQTQNFLVGVDPATGMLLWKLPFKTAFVQNIITPVVYKDLLIYGGYGQPTRAVRLEKTSEGGGLSAREIWSNKDHS